MNSQEWTEKPWTPEIHKSQDRSHIGDELVGGFGNNTKSANTESPKQKDDNGGCMIGLSGSLSGPQSTKSANAELLKQKDNNGRCMIVLSGSHTEPQNGIVDESSMVPSQNGEKWKKIADTIQADNQQEKMTNCVEGDLNGSPSNVKVKVRSLYPLKL